MKEILDQLFAKRSLSREQARAVLLEIVEQKHSRLHVAAFLTVFSMRQVNAEELAGFRDALISRAVPLDLSRYRPVDLCGTGGDGRNTFNISTLSAFVAAGAGVPVAKHGNYAVSSSCGSSNLLEALKVPFPSCQKDAELCLQESNIVFLHAPLWHPAMKEVASARKELGFRTFFNILGPLVNPAKLAGRLCGVFSPDVQELYSQILRGGDESYFIVHSLDGHDEVSLTAPVRIYSKHGEFTLQPEDFGLTRVPSEELKAYSEAAKEAQSAVELLSGRGSRARESAVLANAALAINAARPGETLRSCVDCARDTLRSGKALKVLEKLQRIN